MQISTKGIILGQVNFGDNDRYVTILTEQLGVIEAFAKNAQRMKNKLSVGTQIFAYCQFDLFQNRGKYRLDNAQVISIFYDLRSDIAKIGLASYFAELTRSLVREGDRAEGFLRLFLNCLHFTAAGDKPLPQIKAVFELRGLSICGFMPDVVGCRECCCYEQERFVFFPLEGFLLCGDCLDECDRGRPKIPLNMSILTAMRHILYADFERVFSFRLSEQNLRYLEKVSEKYTLATVERSFRSLDFYHTVC